jgi:hypothetical protein
MADQSSDEAHAPPPTAVADGLDVPSDQGTNGDSTESKKSTSSVQSRIKQSMLDIIKQLREINCNMSKLNSNVDRLQYLVIGSCIMGTITAILVARNG